MQEPTTAFVNHARVSNQVGVQNISGNYYHYANSNGNGWIGDRIPYARGAMFNSLEGTRTECHPNTRVALLKRIQDWARSPTSKPIFWLQGKAGTGKSTISQIVARWLESQQMLGASFFFKRGEHERGNASLFFSTITRQLLTRTKLKGFKDLVTNAVQGDPDIFQKLISEQFERLLYLPLEQYKLSSTSPLQFIVVVDALDECDKAEDIRRILRLWSRLSNIRTCRLRLFITSRPELPIRLEFNSISGQYHQDVDLHDVPERVTRQDLLVYLQYEFETICDNFNAGIGHKELPHTWPGLDILTSLVDMAHPLFIIAATILRFVGDDTSNPVEQLFKILDRQAASPVSQMDKIYRPILDDIVKQTTNFSEAQLWYKDFRYIVGSIILLAEPLAVEPLAQILQLPSRTVISHLRPLHSVLVVPAESHLQIRFLHLSFPEFLQREENSDLPYAVNSSHGHDILGIKCIELLSGPGGLKEDILDLKSPGILLKDISDDTIALQLPKSIQYACQHWIYHVQHNQKVQHDDGVVHNFLKKHFLHWLEVLSLLNIYSEVVNYLNILKSSTAKSAHQLNSFLDDAQRFALANRYIAETAPLQLYSSALLFAPQTSLVKTNYGHTSSMLEFHGHVQQTWNANLMNLEVIGAEVSTLAISHDGSMIASGLSDSTIVIWDLTTGKDIQKLSIGRSLVVAVEFSPDDRYLATCCNDYLLAFDLETAQRLPDLILHDTHVIKLAFLRFDILLVTTDDGKVMTWNLSSGQNLQELVKAPNTGNIITTSPLIDRRQVLAITTSWELISWTIDDDQLSESHSNDLSKLKPNAVADMVSTAAFSCDGQFVAAYAVDTVLVINTLNLDIAHCFDVKDYVSSIAFSRDNHLLAITALRGMIKIQPMNIEQSVKILKSETFVSQVAFSNKSNILVSNSGKNLTQVWNTDYLLHETLELLDSKALNSFAVSPDRRMVVSVNATTGVSLCDMDEGFTSRPLDVTNVGVHNLTISRDGNLIALALFDMTMIILDLRTNKQILRTSPNMSGLFPSKTRFSSARIVVPCLDDVTACLVWDLNSCQPDPATLDVAGIFCDAGIAPDGLHIATLCSTPPQYTWVNFWDANRRGMHANWGFQTPYAGSAFSCFQDQWLLAICEKYKEVNNIRIFDLKTTRPVSDFRHLSSWVTALAFSTDHRLLVSADKDGVILLYDLKQNPPVQVSRYASKASIESMTFSEDNSILYCETGCIRLHLPTDDSKEFWFSSHDCLWLLKGWIVVGETKVLWLPPQYRLLSRVVRHDVIVLCRGTDFVGYLKIDIEGFVKQAPIPSLEDEVGIRDDTLVPKVPDVAPGGDYMVLPSDDEDANTNDNDTITDSQARSPIRRILKKTGIWFKSIPF